jgi:ferredoxin
VRTEARGQHEFQTAPEIQLTIDGKQVSVPAGTTIFDAARVNGIPIPTLCHQQNENPVGVCRVCVVDVGQRVYAASCIRQAEAGMTVKTATEQVQGARTDPDRIADVGPSRALRPAAALGRLRTGTSGRAPRESPNPASRAAPRRGERMTRRR